jgi:two-component system response regulator AlgR
MQDGNLKLLIVDDEALARARLREMVADTGAWRVVEEAANGREALSYCERQAPDVVLLDIRMPGMDGIELAGHLSSLPAPPAVVFTTAYDEYAVNAFDTHAVGYLLKPVRREKLFKALEHAARVSRIKLNALVRENPELGARTNIPTTIAGSIRLIPVDSIVSFHADQKYVLAVYLSEGELHEAVIDDPLKALETEFAADFVRVHRNSLVRLAAIDRLCRDESGQYSLRMRISGAAIAVSRRHVAALKQRLRQ